MRELTPKQRSRVERERRTELLLIVGVTIVGVAVTGLLVYALAIYPAVLAREPVALVDGVPISVAEFQAYVRYTRLGTRQQVDALEQEKFMLSGTADDSTLEDYDYYIGLYEDRLSEANATSLAGQALDALVEFELARQEADRRAITVTDDDVQRQIELFFRYDRDAEAALSQETTELTSTPETTATPVLTSTAEITATPVLTSTPTPTALPTATPKSEASFLEEYNGFLVNSLRPLDISEQMFRSWLAAELLLADVRTAMASEHPTMTEQIELRYIATANEEQANEFAARLEEGEDYQAIVDEIEALTETVESPPTHAELVWYPLSKIEEQIGQAFGMSLVDLVFELEVGAYSEPVLSEDGTTHLIFNVTGHEEERELEPYLLEGLIEQAYEDWLFAKMAEVVERLPYDVSIVPTTP